MDSRTFERIENKINVKKKINEQILITDAVDNVKLAYL